MSASQYALNLGLLAYILWANLGAKLITHRRFTLPLLLVAVAGAIYLRDIPTLGHDASGRLMMRAGAPYPALWVAVIGGRIAFAYGATHWFSQAIARFSVAHQITGAPAWTAAFILMALTMVLTRVAVTALATARATRTVPALAA